MNRNERVAHTLVHELVSLEKHTHTHTRTRQTRHYSTCALIGQNAPVDGIGGVHEDALWRHTTELSARARARVVRVARAMWPGPRVESRAGRVMCGWVVVHTDISAIEFSPHARDKLGGAHRSLIDTR